MSRPAGTGETMKIVERSVTEHIPENLKKRIEEAVNQIGEEEIKKMQKYLLKTEPNINIHMHLMAEAFLFMDRTRYKSVTMSEQYEVFTEYYLVIEPDDIYIVERVATEADRDREACLQRIIAEVIL